MLSLAKLAAGQGASYWLQQAQGRVTHAQSVSSGVEDYYLAGPEATGRWTGSGAGALELAGDVDPEALTRLLDRRDPRTGEGLPRPPGRAPTVPGFDLMFSVPKSASMLFGLGGEREQVAVLRAQRTAVAEAMRYLDDHACLVRRGDGGHIIERGGGLVGATFEHRTSRAGDPQIHTHVLVANLTERADGVWAALDGRAIYHEAKAAGHVHEATFRRELARELGVEWGRVHNGIAEIDGITDEQRAAFSRRSTEIDAYMDEHGLSGPEARQIAAVRTRQAKDYDVTPAAAAPEWRTRGTALGLDRDAIAEVLDRGEFRALGTDTKQSIARELLGPNGLTLQASTFDRRDVVCAFASAAQQGVTREDIEAFVDGFLRDGRVLPLAGPLAEGHVTRSDVIRREDGRLVPAMVQDGRYSTHELAALEQQVIARALRERAVGAGTADPAAVERALAARPTIGADQAAMVRRLCGDGDRVQVVVGPPGTGKTFALDAAREAWETSGYTVVGAAVARRAARRLEASAGIPSTSVAALQRELRMGGEYGLGSRSVAVVDEAGMLGTRDLNEIVAHASDAGAKVVLVGDHKQLPEIDAGGTFRALVVRTDPIVLTENRRQRDEWARRMVKLIRDGDVREGLELASDHGAIVVAPTAEAAQAQLVREWWRASDSGADTMMVAYRRAEVRDLNTAARALMDDEGRLGGARLELLGGEFAAGDRVILKRGSKALDVDNGDAGVVERVDTTQERLIVRLGAAGDRVVTLPRDYLDSGGVGEQPTLVHGYAATGHIHQGATADETFALGSPGLYQEWITTTASRPRARLRFYLADPDSERELDFHASDRNTPEAFEAFVLQAERSQAQTAALDTVHREDVAAMPADVLRAEIDRLQGMIRQAPGPRLERQLASAEADLADAERTAHQATGRRRELERAVSGRAHAGDDVQVDLSRAHAVEADAHAAVGEAGERVHELRVSLAADRWPETHADELARYAAARDELSSRQRTRVMQLRHVETPAYLVAELGERPSEPKQRGVWDRAAVRIEHYRLSFGVTDQSTGLGERPRELRARGAYDQARRDTDAARNRLARDQSRSHARGGGRVAPPPRQQSLGLGR
jgi:conjugative relaxase-like TrwC/TraI family protein